MASTHDLSPLAQAGAGAIASVLSNTIVYPLDTVTTRLQTSSRKKTGGVQALVDAIKSIIRSEGISSLYRGLLSDSISTGLSNLIFFAAYSWLHDRILQRKIVGAALANSSGKNVTGKGKTPPAALSAVEGIIVGCLAGIVAKSIVLPLSNITVQQQTAATSSSALAGQNKAGDNKGQAVPDSDDDSEDGTYDRTPSAIEVAREIIEEKGWTGLWSGMSASIILTLNPSITFYAFDALKRAFIPKKHQAHPTALQTFLAGAVASSIASTVTYPLILAKTRLQFKTASGRRLYKSNADVFRKTIKKHGVAGLYQGIEGQLAKNFLSEGVKLTFKERIEVLIILAHRSLSQRRA